MGRNTTQATFGMHPNTIGFDADSRRRKTAYAMDMDTALPDLHIPGAYGRYDSSQVFLIYLCIALTLWRALQ